MSGKPFLKPSYDEWQQQAQVVIDRLTTCVHVYSKPPYEDIFMAEKERQDKNTATLDLLRRIYKLVEESETPTDSLADVAHHDERVIAGLRILMQNALDQLPGLSQDMQKLLKSSWFDKCNGRLASELFRGPLGDEAEGIGSGFAEHGRLPLVLTNLLEREAEGDSRQPRRDLHRDEPQRLDEQEELKRRWTDRTSSTRSSAGGVQ